METKSLNKAWMGLFLFYLPLCYFSLYREWGLDFFSYFQAADVLSHGGNPYINVIHYLPDWGPAQGVPANPNPPITLSLFSVFTHWGYRFTFFIWLGLSNFLGVMGVYKTLHTLCPKLCQTKEIRLFMLIYFASYPVLMNTIMLQFGGCVLFFIAMGYEAYLKKQEKWCGFWWGSLIALKLFPGLLLIYSFLKKQYSLVGWILGWSVVLSLIPLLFISDVVYVSYLKAISHHIFWYGVNWNMSLLGYLYRLCVPVVMDANNQNYMPLSGVEVTKWLYWGFVLGVVGLWLTYFKRIEQGGAHRGFAVVLLLMLWLSPFGWLYFFPMLLIPLICTLNDACASSKRLIAWFVSVFFLCFPMPVTHAISMPNWFSKAGIYSIHFYGLVILTYLTCTYTKKPENFIIRKLPLIVKQSIIGIISFGLTAVVFRCGLYIVKWVLMTGL